MKNKDMRTKIIVISSVILLLLGVIGFSYSFFSLTVTGTGNNVTVSSTTIHLTYTDGPTFTLTDAFPGDSIEKTVTVANDGQHDVYYNYVWNNLTNTFKNYDLVLSFTCTSYSTYVSEGSAGNVVSGECPSITNKTVTTSSTSISDTIISGISINTGITHEYKMKILFLERDTLQNTNIGSSFTGTINVTDSALNTSGVDTEIASVMVNGIVSAPPTSGTYYITNQYCNNGASLEWSNTDHSLSVADYTTYTSCTVELKSQPLLSEVANIGDYILYEGSNGCNSTSNNQLDTVFNSQCKGMNVNYESSSSMGYCNSSNNKFYTTGWRVSYFLDSDSDNILEPYIVSAGSPSCVAGTDSDLSATITSLNTEAIKYCNSNYAYGGGCQTTYDTVGTNYNTWTIKGLDYYQITLQLFGEGRRLYSYDTATENSIGTTCYDVWSSKACGHNENLIDNGSWYWFGSAYNSMNTLYWNPRFRQVYSVCSAAAFGIRTVVHLKSSIYVSAGSGTQSDPYIIGY